MRLIDRFTPPRLVTDRLELRAPVAGDHPAWAAARRESAAHLTPWEPAWSADHLGARAFRRRVAWARREIGDGRAYPFLLFRRADRRLLGGVTIEHVRRGAAQSAALGYWLRAGETGRGWMTEALEEVVRFAFDDLDLSRLEAACLPENAPSRRLLRRCGFEEEAMARHYLQIDGAWRDHVIHARRRSDRL